MSRITHVRSRHRGASPARRALYLAALASLPLPAFAINRTYTGPTGLWSNPANWGPAGVPTSADGLFIQASFSPNVIVTYDGSVTNTTFISVNVNANTFPIILQQTANTFTTTRGETIGTSS